MSTVVSSLYIYALLQCYNLYWRDYVCYSDTWSISQASKCELVAVSCVHKS
jgi:hypothetical protein